MHGEGGLVPGSQGGAEDNPHVASFLSQESLQEEGPQPTLPCLAEASAFPATPRVMMTGAAAVEGVR